MAELQENRPKKKKYISTSDGSRENYLISLATDLAEKQLMEGTASSQVITHFLKLGTEQARLERVQLECKNELTKAQIDAMKSVKKQEEMYAKAIEAMRIYSGGLRDDD